tara:strand:- start:5883 stop:6323 length:441 start_codon:yes stop_codon:yes gene_type:complete
MIENIPLPATDDPIDAPFWEGTRCGELRIQTCQQCGRMRFPPRPMCPACQSHESDWQPVSGRGRVWSFAVPSSPLLPAFEKLTPYVVALVELEESPTLRMIGTVVHSAGGEVSGVESQDVHIGAEVTVDFKHYSDDVAMPCWVLGK